MYLRVRINKERQVKNWKEENLFQNYKCGPIVATTSEVRKAGMFVLSIE
jgi:hypothetical protein